MAGFASVSASSYAPTARRHSAKSLDSGQPGIVPQPCECRSRARTPAVGPSHVRPRAGFGECVRDFGTRGAFVPPRPRSERPLLSRGHSLRGELAGRYGRQAPVKPFLGRYLARDRVSQAASNPRLTVFAPKLRSSRPPGARCGIASTGFRPVPSVRCARRRRRFEAECWRRRSCVPNRSSTHRRTRPDFASRILQIYASSAQHPIGPPMSSKVVSSDRTLCRRAKQKG